MGGLALLTAAVHRDVRRVRVLHADDVVAGIDMVHLAGDAAREIIRHGAGENIFEIG